MLEPQGVENGWDLVAGLVRAGAVSGDSHTSGRRSWGSRRGRQERSSCWRCQRGWKTELRGLSASRGSGSTRRTRGKGKSSVSVRSSWKGKLKELRGTECAPEVGKAVLF